MASRDQQVRDWIAYLAASPSAGRKGAPWKAALRQEIRESVERAIDDLDNEVVLGGPDDTLEAIVLPGLRPVYDVDGAELAATGNPVWPELVEHRANVERVIRATGRVEMEGNPQVPYAGTGFVVGDGLLLTNRHVAALFMDGVGTEVRFKSGFTAGWHTRREAKVWGDEPPLRVRSARVIHPALDAALLEVEGLADLEIEPLTLAGTPPDVIDDVPVFVVGYPARDGRNDLAVQDDVFHGRYQIKRLAPGRVRGGDAQRSFGHDVATIVHDCSTLGGNSGSAVVDVATGQVLGLHFRGRYLEKNHAVPAWELARDARVRAAPVQFALPRPADDPWRADYAEAPAPGTVPVTATSPAEAPVGDLDDDALLARYRADRAGTEAALRSEQGEAAEVTVEALRTLDGGAAEGVELAGADPTRPDIVLIPGILGSNLARPFGLPRRVWLSVGGFAFGGISGPLRLQPDGVLDAQPPGGIAPDGFIRPLYGIPALAWRAAGFQVHEFSYDWRKSLHLAAQRLHHFLEQLALDRPGKRFVLVAHSMGGLVAAMYSHLAPAWADRVEEAVFLGSPLGGSFAVTGMLTGTYGLARRLGELSPGDTPESLRRMAATLPGLVQMLPNPALFSEAEHGGDLRRLYRAETWPSVARPGQRWLTESARIKEMLRTAPILPQTTLLMGLRHPTLASVAAQGAPVGGERYETGDGTVPSRSAYVRDVRAAYEASWEHVLLPAEPAVVRAVTDLVRTGRCDLPPLDVARVGLPLARSGAEAPESGPPSGAVERATSGALSLLDLAWLVHGKPAAEEEILEPFLEVSPGTPPR